MSVAVNYWYLAYAVDPVLNAGERSLLVSNSSISGQLDQLNG
ncbi:MAG: hypothetical protein WCK24_01730 [Actinomycetes bacterium]